MVNPFSRLSILIKACLKIKAPPGEDYLISLYSIKQAFSVSPHYITGTK
jgi:hypothetical protein